MFEFILFLFYFYFVVLKNHIYDVTKVTVGCVVKVCCVAKCCQTLSKQCCQMAAHNSQQFVISKKKKIILGILFQAFFPSSEKLLTNVQQW